MMPPTPTRSAIRFLALAAGLFFLGRPHPAAAPPAGILGWWHGTSTCVREAWNRACNDEVVEYQFVPNASDSGHVLLHAFKLVGREYQPMGDLSFVPADESRGWNGDFANGRVDIRWNFRDLGDSLAGELFLRPDMRTARHVVAWRGRAARSP